MENLFDPATQVGNPTLLFIERFFWLGLGLFLFAALARSILQIYSHNDTSNN